MSWHGQHHVTVFSEPCLSFAVLKSLNYTCHVVYMGGCASSPHSPYSEDWRAQICFQNHLNGTTITHPGQPVMKVGDVSSCFEALSSVGSKHTHTAPKETRYTQFSSHCTLHLHKKKTRLLALARSPSQHGGRCCRTVWFMNQAANIMIQQSLWILPTWFVWNVQAWYINTDSDSRLLYSKASKAAEVIWDPDPKQSSHKFLSDPYSDSVWRDNHVNLLQANSLQQLQPDVQETIHDRTHNTIVRICSCETLHQIIQTTWSQARQKHRICRTISWHSGREYGGKSCASASDKKLVISLKFGKNTMWKLYKTQDHRFCHYNTTCDYIKTNWSSREECRISAR